MAFDRFLIAPSETGLDTSMRPWLIPDDAFAQLENAYVFRGRVRKRFGSFLMGSGGAVFNLNQLLSRLRIALPGGAAVGITDAGGNATGTVPGAIFKQGQLFSIGTEIFTVQATGTPVVMLTTGTSTTHTYNTTTGAYVFTGATALTQIYFYPAEPVMGLTIFENGPVQNQPTYGFDTQFAYIFTGGSWQRSGTGSSPIWHGNNLDFFWAATFRYVATQTSLTALFVSNFFAVNPNGAVSGNDDPIWYLDSASNTWTAFTPIVLTAGNMVLTARIIVPFKGRLVLLNTIEVNAAGNTNSNFVNRARFSQVGDPIATNAFLEITQVGALGGGVIDAPTAEEIVTAEFIKDRLIVYFERSTYELAWTGNDLVPFEWRQLNTELGSESTFSVVPFDQEVLAIGDTGVHSCNGSNVVRIDNKIPDTIFTIKNVSEATERVAGIRDYFAEMVYWTYPSDNEITVDTYPNKVLVFNYKNRSWAENDDCITAFGYFEQGLSITWANSTPSTWGQSENAWNSGILQAQARRVIAGNQQGFTFLILTDLTRNAPVMQLSNATLSGTTLTLTIIDHTLEASSTPDTGDYISIENASGSTNLNRMIFPINSVVDKDTVTVIVPTGFTLPATYSGGGIISRVSNIRIKSKQWNPYDKEGQNVYLARIDFGVLRTENGEITVDYFPSSSELSMLRAGQATGSIMGNGVLETKPYPITLYPFEQEQDRLWHPIYFQSTGECIQIYMYMSDVQMRSLPITWSPFEMEGLILHTAKASARMQ